MKSFKMSFEMAKPLESDEKKDFVDSIWGYLGCLYNNGQILRDYELLENNSLYIVYVTSPEKDSISDKNNNALGKEALKELKRHCNIEVELIGTNVNLDDSCTCKKPSNYILYTRFDLPVSPVVCGDCNKNVPLYKLPSISGNGEFGNLLTWQNTYKSFDEIWINSFNEKFAYKQLSTADSEVSRVGRAICDEFENVTKKPFYYYLYNYYKNKKNCPICGGDWKVNDEKSSVDYKCDKCMIVTNKTN